MQLLMTPPTLNLSAYLHRPLPLMGQQPMTPTWITHKHPKNPPITLEPTHGFHKPHGNVLTADTHSRKPVLPKADYNPYEMPSNKVSIKTANNAWKPLDTRSTNSSTNVTTMKHGTSFNLSTIEDHTSLPPATRHYNKLDPNSKNYTNAHLPKVTPSRDTKNLTSQTQFLTNLRSLRPSRAFGRRKHLVPVASAMMTSRPGVTNANTNPSPGYFLLSSSKMHSKLVHCQPSFTAIY